MAVRCMVVPCLLLLASLCNAAHTLDRRRFLGAPEDVAKAKVMSASKVAVQTSAVAVASKSKTEASTEERTAMHALFTDLKKFAPPEDEKEEKEEEEEEPEKTKGTRQAGAMRWGGMDDGKNHDDVKDSRDERKFQRRHHHVQKTADGADDNGDDDDDKKPLIPQHISYDEFEPGCLEHVSTLVARADKSYTDRYLEDHLRSACEMDQEFGAEIHEDGFKDKESCDEHAKDLYEARRRELNTGKTDGYRAFCKSFYEHHYPPQKKEKKVEKAAARSMTTVTAAAALLVGTSVVNALF